MRKSSHYQRNKDLVIQAFSLLIAGYEPAAGYQPVVMSLRLTHGDENPA
jgi:hypothetical protein